MTLPAWVVYLALAVVFSGALASPQFGSVVAAFTAWFVAVRMIVIGIKMRDKVELL